MNANQADAKVATMCRVLRVSSNGCYDWLDRAPSARWIDDAALVELVQPPHALVVHLVALLGEQWS